MADEKRAKRLDVGFSGGQVLSLRARDEARQALVSALEGDRGPRWHELETEDSVVSIDLSQVVYVRVDTERQHVGF